MSERERCVWCGRFMGKNTRINRIPATKSTFLFEASEGYIQHEDVTDCLATLNKMPSDLNELTAMAYPRAAEHEAGKT